RSRHRYGGAAAHRTLDRRLVHGGPRRRADWSPRAGSRSRFARRRRSDPRRGFFVTLAEISLCPRRPRPANIGEKHCGPTLLRRLTGGDRIATLRTGPKRAVGPKGAPGPPGGP